jgi:hypothetical protein
VIGGVLAGAAAAASGGGILAALAGSLAVSISAATIEVLYPKRASGAGGVIARLIDNADAEH